MSSELLLEVRTDPLPCELVESGCQRLKNSLVRELRAHGLQPRQSAMGFSARRLLVLLRGLQVDLDGDPEARERGLALIGEVVTGVVEGLSWPRTMRWGDDRRWVAPVRGVLLLLDGEPVPARILGVEATDQTVGPESSGARPVRVEGAEHYGREMGRLGVELRYPERRRMVLEALEAAAREQGGSLLPDADLLRTRALACETPGVVAVTVDQRFAGLPRELIQVCLRNRLAGFCVVDEGEEVLAALFVTDRPVPLEESISRSYRWALQTYLDDVAFFLERDRRRPLAEACRELEARTLSACLGTYGERATRCARICDLLCNELGWDSERDRAREAIRLLSADGRTELLRSFPDLEGFIGGLLAREEGYPASVWQAIADSCRPAREAKTMPRGRVGKLVALSERSDRLASEFLASVSALGEEAREELAPDWKERQDAVVDQMVRIAVAGGMAVDLRLVTAFALRQRATSESGRGLAGWLEDLNDVVGESIRRIFVEMGFAPQEIAAVQLGDGSSLLRDQVRLLETLRTVRGDERLQALGQTASRITGILQGSSEHSLDVALLAEGSERDMYFVYRRLSERIDAALREGAAADWIRWMIEMNEKVEQFLREILVRDEVERIRQNRLALLQRIYWLYAGELRLAELLEEAPAAWQGTTRPTPAPAEEGSNG